MYNVHVLSTYYQFNILIYTYTLIHTHAKSKMPYTTSVFPTFQKIVLKNKSCGFIRGI